MMKTVAVPVSELRAMAMRDSERRQLQTADTVAVADKQMWVESAQNRINEFNADIQRQRDEITDSEDTDEIKAEAIGKINEKAQEEIWPLQLSLEKANALLTDEDRGNRLTALAAEDQSHKVKYGPQPLNAEDLAQANADEVAHAEYVETKKYADDRVGEYPSTGDQLDALWLGLKALSAGEKLPAETEAMISAIEAVKAKYPKPGADNG